MESSKWGTAGWWIIVTLSVPFAVYAALFTSGNFDIYKRFTLTWLAEHYDTAGLNVLHHVRAWQMHSVAAEVFILTGPFQFNSSFRKKNLIMHRRLGYTFVAAGTVISISGILFMLPYSEFGMLGRTVFFVQGLFFICCMSVAVKMARQKNIEVHQKYMIRGAAAGYGFPAVRLTIPLLLTLGVDIWWGIELGALLSPVILVSLAEVYIRTVMSPEPTQEQEQKGLTSSPDH